MERRTRLLPKLLNSEVSEYLNHNDIIIVPVGTVELHDLLPLDCETVLSEAFALKMAEACDALVLPNLPYFYAGATAIGQGTVQVSIREGTAYLSAIAHSLLRQGFKRQIYISLHGPAHMTCSPMVRDFFDETGVPILYIDMALQMMQQGKGVFNISDAASFMHAFDCMAIGAYDILGRLEDIPLQAAPTTPPTQATVAPFGRITGLAYQSGAIGHYFGKPTDHASYTFVDTPQTRQAYADQGKIYIDKLVQGLDLPDVVEKMRDLHQFEEGLKAEYPWMPSAYAAREK